MVCFAHQLQDLQERFPSLWPLHRRWQLLMLVRVTAARAGAQSPHNLEEYVHNSEESPHNLEEMGAISAQLGINRAGRNLL